MKLCKDCKNRGVKKMCQYYTSLSNYAEKCKDFEPRSIGQYDNNDIKREIINFAVAVLAEVNECAKQEDAPIYEGDKEVDYFVRLSEVNAAINKYLN